MTLSPRIYSALPSECDVDFYRNSYADLRHLSDNALLQHFRNHGIAEGRSGSAATTRAGFLGAIPVGATVLEIGPFCSPALTGDEVRYLDVLDRVQLCERARAIGISPEGCPEIDYVSPTADLSVVDRKFSHVFSSHSIEHQPDLVRHLAEVAKILEPPGRYFIIVPDKRYCFDFFLPQSSIADVLAAYVEKRVVHSACSVLEHRALLTHNDPERHWRGDHGFPDRRQSISQAANALQELEYKAGAYIDVHAWHFTPDNFRDIVISLNELGLCSFDVERIYPTVYGSLEFGAILKHRTPHPLA